VQSFLAGARPADHDSHTKPAPKLPGKGSVGRDAAFQKSTKPHLASEPSKQGKLLSQPSGNQADPKPADKPSHYGYRPAKPIVEVAVPLESKTRNAPTRNHGIASVYAAETVPPVPAAADAHELQETIKILQMKMQKMEELLELKEEKIQKLSSSMTDLSLKIGRK
ncbi:hypothetical protein HDU91_002712, partial [Kappamyces sp. JEL0680]